MTLLNIVNQSMFIMERESMIYYWLPSFLFYSLLHFLVFVRFLVQQQVDLLVWWKVAATWSTIQAGEHVLARNARY